MCYNPSPIRDKPLGAPAFVKLVYSVVTDDLATRGTRASAEIICVILFLPEFSGFSTGRVTLRSKSRMTPFVAYIYLSARLIAKIRNMVKET